MITPLNYKIHIEPNINNFTFDGVVEIEMQSQEAVQEVVLNSLDLIFHNCNVEQNHKSLDCVSSLNATLQQATITFPESIRGNFKVSISYSGEINDRYAGLYRSKYQHDGQKKIIVSTQFEASDTRRVFPCFDQPDLKATFEIEYFIDTSLTGISNTGILEEISLAANKKLVRFERTPKMSTYLVFFGMGEFEFLEDRSEHPLVRIATTPGKTQFAQYALDMARKSLKFGTEYTGIPYPLSKCDYIAIPDSMGAMENFGAIRHAEDVLLVYPAITSKSRQILIAKIIAHEGIHMWFGDLVSPTAWKYLWLNEAFATYFTYVIPHHYYPEWGVWEQFFPERLLSGLERDSLQGTIPIDLPDSDNPNADPAPTPSTAPIVYNKGASVMRMLAAYLGEEGFRQGLHDFLEEYKFGAASSAQFWASIGEFTGKPVEQFTETWIHQAGYPLIEVEQHEDSLHLSQGRFSYHQKALDGNWFIPLDILLFQENGETRTLPVVFDDPKLLLNLPSGVAAYKLNAEFSGFYRVLYPQENLENLGRLIREQRLSSVDSMNVLSDLFVLVKAGKYTQDNYLYYVERFCGSEDRYLPLTVLAKDFELLQLVSTDGQAECSRLGLHLFERGLRKLELTPADDEALTTTELRETLMWAAYLSGSQEVAEFACAQFQKYFEGQAVHNDILTTVLKIGAARHGNALELLLSMAADSDCTEGERIMALEAMGNLSDQGQLEQALETNFLDIPKSLQSYMIIATAQNPAALGFMWAWLHEHFPQIEAYPQHVIERIIVGLVPLCGLEFQQEVIVHLSNFTHRHPRSADSVKMALELLEVNKSLRRN